MVKLSVSYCLRGPIVKKEVQIDDKDHDTMPN